MGYTKLFSELVASSIWDEDDTTRILWITMLALKDRNHFVRGTEKWLQAASRIPDDALFQASLKKLSNPDPNSKNQDKDGRRITKAEGGWLIVSGDYYQRMLSQEERREYNRQKQSEYRKRKSTVKNEGAKSGAKHAIKEVIDEWRLKDSGND